MQENKIEDAVREYTQMVLNIAYTYTKNSHDAERKFKGLKIWDGNLCGEK